MKKTIFTAFLLVFSLLLLSIGSNNAFCGEIAGKINTSDKVPNEKITEKREEIKTTITENAEEYFDAEDAKVKIVIAIDNAILLLEETKKSISTSSLSQDTKNEANSIIDETITTLENFKIEINSVESMEDILALKDEVKAYVKSQKDELKSLLQKVQKELSEITVEQISAAVDELNQALNLLKVICPKQADEINTIQGNLDSIESLIISIDVAIKEEDYAEVAKLIMQSQEILTETVQAMEKIMESTCI